MKTNLFKYALSVGLFLFLLACSTKKNSFVRRNYHAVTTEYNILYNGGIAFDKGVEELKGTYKDNFWETLPVERMQDAEAGTLPGQAKNANFDRAETKAIKAIQKHSMYIEGGEKNPQIDEAHLLLGKARYYDNRFIPALEAFNYILYKYSNSDKIYEAKVWREKTNIRLENEVLAIKNLKKLLEDQKLKGQVQADANAILAQAYMNLGSIDSALVNLKEAKDLTKHNEEKARYHFIIGQLYESLNYPDSAYASFQSVIDMKRRSPRRYVIQAHAKQAQQFDSKKGDTLAFLEKFHKLAEDRENRPYLDVINHQMALFYDKEGNKKQAKKYYNKSLRSGSQDNYLLASNYRNLAEINFDDAKYLVAGQYYDSTMSKLNPKTREFIAIKKKRENLNDVIKYEGIARVNDSILYVTALNPNAQRNYYEEYIAKLKIEEAKRALEAEKMKTMAENSGFSDPGTPGVGSNAATKSEMMQSRQMPPEASETTSPKQSGLTNAGSIPAGNSTFYFYNQSTVAFGRTEFKKKWGNRPLKDNWRWSTQDIIEKGNEDNSDAVAVADENPKNKAEDERFTPDYYIKQLPTDQKVLDSLAKERNFAYFQLGTIYKEKFKEYKLAASRLEKLLVNKPEERLVLPAKYNLFKIYEIIDPAKAAVMKQQIISEYPDSRYAQILLNNLSESTIAGSPEEVYNKLFKQFEKDELQDVLAQLDPVIENFNGEEMVPKFELLKASVIGRLKGLEEYKKALNFVALNYPNAEEGKKAEALLKTDIPKLEKLELGKESPASWKIVFQVPYPNANDAKTKALTEKLKKYVADRNSNKITLSNDVYTSDKSFVIVHGFNSKEAALSTISVLKDFKGYKVSENAFVISNEDYKVVQIKKNLDAFLATLK